MLRMLTCHRLVTLEVWSPESFSFHEETKKV